MPIWECMVYDNFMIPRKNKNELSPEKNPLAFHNSGCLIGILIVVCLL